MIYFIVNPHSRSGKALEIWKKIEQTLINRNISYSYQFTEYIGHAVTLATEITSAASANDPITLIILGGDGTVNEVYNGICNHNHITLGYIPTGSGNDFARGLNLPRDPDMALDNILNSKRTQKIECGILSDSKKTRRFAVSCGMGYDATITYKVINSKLKKLLNKIGLGKLVYTAYGIIQIITNQKNTADIYVDGKLALHAQNLYFASVHVLKYEGGGFPFALHANPSDGLLSVCVFHDTSRLRFASNLIASMFSKHTTRKGVSTFQCKTCTVISNECDHVHTDGEDFGHIKEMTATICKDEEFINIII